MTTDLSDREQYLTAMLDYYTNECNKKTIECADIYSKLILAQNRNAELQSMLTELSLAKVD